MRDWQIRAQQKIASQRQVLRDQRRHDRLIEGGLKWSIRNAQARVSPLNNPDGYLRELDRWLPKAQNWIQGEIDGLRE